MDTAAAYLGGDVRFEPTDSAVHGLFITLVLQAAAVVAPFMIAALVAGLAAQLVQVGFLLSGEPLKPKLERINPVEGFKRMFSRRAVVNMLKAMAKIAVVGWIAYREVRRSLDMLPMLTSAALTDAAALVGGIVLRTGLNIGFALLVIAALDYMFQRLEHERSLRMTRQEVREELKQTEGDPQVRARIRRRQRELASRRMMQAVPTADVVVTNPVHLAVALKYDQATMEAPVVVAKGAGIVARRIMEVAEEHGVPVVEDVALARALYDGVELGPGDSGRAVPPWPTCWHSCTGCGAEGGSMAWQHNPRTGIGAAAGRHSDVGVVLAVVFIIIMMIVPLPTWLIDLLLAVNISVALLILMLTMNVQHALQFSIFPSLLLVVTLFRLGLNVSTTRLILLHADAGRIIDGFGQFVIGGNYVVGFVVFLILIVIQFIVITRGAERVAEVAARFTLDAMRKQMSIGADLNGGLITERAPARKDIGAGDFVGRTAPSLSRRHRPSSSPSSTCGPASHRRDGRITLGSPPATPSSLSDGLVTQIPRLSPPPQHYHHARASETLTT